MEMTHQKAPTLSISVTSQKEKKGKEERRTKSVAPVFAASRKMKLNKNKL
jgi:hypothetical protein